MLRGGDYPPRSFIIVTLNEVQRSEKSQCNASFWNGMNRYFGQPKKTCLSGLVP